MFRFFRDISLTKDLGKNKYVSEQSSEKYVNSSKQPANCEIRSTLAKAGNVIMNARRKHSNLPFSRLATK